jgi:hypothetical protein
VLIISLLIAFTNLNAQKETVVGDPEFYSKVQGEWVDINPGVDGAKLVIIGNEIYHFYISNGRWKNNTEDWFNGNNHFEIYKTLEKTINNYTGKVKTTSSTCAENSADKWGSFYRFFLENDNKGKQSLTYIYFSKASAYDYENHNDKINNGFILNYHYFEQKKPYGYTPWGRKDFSDPIYNTINKEDSKPISKKSLSAIKNNVLIISDTSKGVKKNDNGLKSLIERNKKLKELY